MISTFTIHIIILFIIALLLLLNLIYKKKKEPFIDVTTDNIQLIQSTVDSIYDIKMNNIRTLSNIISKLLNGDVSGDLDIIGGIDIIPTGYVMAYTGSSDIIQYTDLNGNNIIGWFICDGRAISKTLHNRLYSKIGDIFNNNTTDKNMFNLPDYRGAFLRGTGQNILNPNNNSGPLNTYQECSIINHTHNVIDKPHFHYTNFQFDKWVDGNKRTYIEGDDYNPYYNGHMQLQSNTVANPDGKKKPYIETTSKNFTDIQVKGVSNQNNKININVNETRPTNYAVNWIIKT
jgi:microcystin-dependent protein